MEHNWQVKICDFEMYRVPTSTFLDKYLKYFTNNNYIARLYNCYNYFQRK